MINVYRFYITAALHNNLVVPPNKTKGHSQLNDAAVIARLVFRQMSFAQVAFLA